MLIEYMVKDKASGKWFHMRGNFKNFEAFWSYRTTARRAGRLVKNPQQIT